MTDVHNHSHTTSIYSHTTPTCLHQNSPSYLNSVLDMVVHDISERTIGSSGNWYDAWHQLAASVQGEMSSLYLPSNTPRTRGRGSLARKQKKAPTQAPVGGMFSFPIPDDEKLYGSPVQHASGQAESVALAHARAQRVRTRERQQERQHQQQHQPQHQLQQDQQGSALGQRQFERQRQRQRSRPMQKQRHRWNAPAPPTPAPSRAQSSISASVSPQRRYPDVISQPSSQSSSSSSMSSVEAVILSSPPSFSPPPQTSAFTFRADASARGVLVMRRKQREKQRARARRERGRRRRRVEQREVRDASSNVSENSSSGNSVYNDSVYIGSNDENSHGNSTMEALQLVMKSEMDAALAYELEQAELLAYASGLNAAVEGRTDRGTATHTSNTSNTNNTNNNNNNNNDNNYANIYSETATASAGGASASDDSAEIIVRPSLVQAPWATLGDEYRYRHRRLGTRGGRRQLSSIIETRRRSADGAVAHDRNFDSNESASESAHRSENRRRLGNHSRRSHRRRSSSSTRTRTRTSSPEWELNDFSYDSLLELGSMAVQVGLAARDLKRIHTFSFSSQQKETQHVNKQHAQKAIQSSDRCPAHAGDEKDASGHTSIRSERKSTVMEESCCICLLDFEEGDECSQLSCSHVFHTKCIAVWLKKSPLCCLCRKDQRIVRGGRLHSM